jgi:phosphatidylserine/phosphatidylglycerophosphate/cardiolipin synthase-like enzyme
MTQVADGSEGSLLGPGAGVWRSAPAGRFSILMENEAYFDALSSALQKAERSIVILGWQFDPRTHLDPGPLWTRVICLFIRHKPALYSFELRCIILSRRIYSSPVG